MAGQIRMTPAAMRDVAAQYSVQAGNLQDVITSMDVLLGRLKDEWEGDASVAYEERFNELKPGFEAARELIDSIANTLNSTADAYENADQEIASQLRG